MICNKCGKNNPAGAEICSNCKEPMPPAVNCGGFADILTYSAPPVSEALTEAAPVREEIRAEVRRIPEEVTADEPWYKDFLSKKNIICLITIAVCIITLAVVIAVWCAAGNDDGDNGYSAGNREENVSSSDGTQEDDVKNENTSSQRVLETSKVAGFPTPEFSSSRKEIEIVISDNSGKPVDNMVIVGNGEDNKVSKDRFEDGLCITFTADESQFPLTVKYDDAVQAGKLELDKDGNIVWKESVLVEKKGIAKLNYRAGTIVTLKYDGETIVRKKEIKETKDNEIEITVEVASDVKEINVDVYVGEDGDKKEDTVTVKLTEA